MTEKHLCSRSKISSNFSCFCRRLQENRLESFDAHLFLKLRSLKILDISQNRLMSSLPLDLFQSIYHLKGERFTAIELVCLSLFTRFYLLAITLNWFMCTPTLFRVESISKWSTWLAINWEICRISKTNQSWRSSTCPTTKFKLSTATTSSSRKSSKLCDSRRISSVNWFRSRWLNSPRFPLDKIASDAFVNLLHLQCLYLKKNLITHVNEKHFRNLRNLIILDLAANKIQSIHSNAFRSLTKIFELHLSQNIIKEIPENLFEEMGRLKKLMLFSNDFRYLRSQYFTGLR